MNDRTHREFSTSDELATPVRFFLALMSAPAIGILFGFLVSMGVSGVDGEFGYTALVNSAIVGVISFFVLIFIVNKQVLIWLSILSVAFFAFSLFKM